MTISVARVYPSQWISPDDVTRPTTVVIQAITVEDFRRPDGTKEPKIVLQFLRAQRRLPLNKTQAKALARLLGDNAEQWQGETIILAPATAPNHKRTIAVGIPSKPPAAETTTADDDDDPDPDAA